MAANVGVEVGYVWGSVLQEDGNAGCSVSGYSAQWRPYVTDGCRFAADITYSLALSLSLHGFSAFHCTRHLRTIFNTCMLYSVVKVKVICTPEEPTKAQRGLDVQLYSIII